MADAIVPVANNKIEEQKKISSPGIFGWGEDFFDNEELFHQIDWTAPKPKIEIENDTEDLDIDINEDNKKWEVISEDTFDPIFSDEEEKIEENQSAKDEIQEDKNEIIEWELSEPKITEEKKIEEIVENEDEVIEEEEEEEVQEVMPVVVSNPRSSTVQTTETKSNNEDKVNIIAKDIPEEIYNTIPDEVEEEQERTMTDEEKIEIEPEKEESDLMKKFLELVNKTKELYNLANMEETEYVELIWWDTGKSEVIYNLRLIKEDEESDSILISKIETEKESWEQEQNNLQLKNSYWSLEIILDEQVLYDEIEDLQDDQNKKMQVIDKINKFIFLVSEELKVYERDRKEKERMEQERRKLRDIFRNF